MDPNVQVALVSVLATLITTAGVVVVAVINNRRERGQAASAGVEAGLDEGDVLKRMLSLIAENERKEITINRLRKENKRFEEDISQLRIENSYLRLNLPLEEGEQ